MSKTCSEKASLFVTQAAGNDPCVAQETAWKEEGKCSPCSSCLAGLPGLTTAQRLSQPNQLSPRLCPVLQAQGALLLQLSAQSLHTTMLSSSRPLEPAHSCLMGW